MPRSFRVSNRRYAILPLHGLDAQSSVLAVDRARSVLADWARGASDSQLRSMYGALAPMHAGEVLDRRQIERLLLDKIGHAIAVVAKPDMIGPVLLASAPAGGGTSRPVAAP